MTSGHTFQACNVSVSMRRRQLILGTGALALGSMSIQVSAQTLGSEGFRIVAPFPPGGPVDSLSRLLEIGRASCRERV